MDWLQGQLQSGLAHVKAGALALAHIEIKAIGHSGPRLQKLVLDGCCGLRGLNGRAWSFSAGGCLTSERHQVSDRRIRPSRSSADHLHRTSYERDEQVSVRLSLRCCGPLVSAGCVESLSVTTMFVVIAL